MNNFEWIYFKLNKTLLLYNKNSFTCIELCNDSNGWFRFCASPMDKQFVCWSNTKYFKQKFYNDTLLLLLNLDINKGLTLDSSFSHFTWSFTISQYNIFITNNNVPKSKIVLSPVGFSYYSLQFLKFLNLTYNNIIYNKINSSIIYNNLLVNDLNFITGNIKCTCIKNNPITHINKFDDIPSHNISYRYSTNFTDKEDIIKHNIKIDKLWW